MMKAWDVFIVTVLLLNAAFHHGVSSLLSPLQHRPPNRHQDGGLFETSSSKTVNDVVTEDEDAATINGRGNKLLIHWKGEDVEGYSLQFRHVEFRGALSSVLAERHGDISDCKVQFENALNYTGSASSEMSQLKLDCYNQAMQYVTVDASTLGITSTEMIDSDTLLSACIEATQRCSLIHALYEVVAETTSSGGCTTHSSSAYEDLNRIAMENGGFQDMEAGQIHSSYTWCVRVRHYGKNATVTGKDRRYGHRARSLTMERQALQALKPILLTFGGKVNLKHPDCKIYVFDGLASNNNNDDNAATSSLSTTAVLARRIATGPRVSILNPNTRICVTNTPLCPIASFTMCNVAQLRANQTVLDPFAGSCAILLAAAMIEPTTKTVGIEIAHNGIVNRDHVRNDFATRNLVEPAALIYGDSSDGRIRERARSAIGGGQPFDCIITDPPYGIRESTGYVDATRPIDEIFKMLCNDRKAGTPLLKKGGRLVVFLPCQHEEESFCGDVMPSDEQIRAAGLRFELRREQPLNDVLSRWLVSFLCTV